MFDVLTEKSGRAWLGALFLILALVLGVVPVQAGQPLVAAIITGDLERYRQAHEALVEELRAAGFGEDKVTIYVQVPNPDPISWANSIRKAVGIGASLILTYGAPPTLAAQKEARDIPVVFADVYDPIGLGIVRGSNPPGGNITGISGKTPLETLLKTLREISPVKTMGVLFSSIDRGSVLQVENLSVIAEKSGIRLVRAEVKRPEDLPAVLEVLPPQVDCLFVSESVILPLRFEEILAFARSRKLPVVSQVPGLCDRGALITLEADPVEQGEVAGSFAMQVLSGVDPGRLPIRTPRKVSLIINLKAARELNLRVPFQALSLATRVIQ